MLLVVGVVEYFELVDDVVVVLCVLVLYVFEKCFVFEVMLCFVFGFELFFDDVLCGDVGMVCVWYRSIGNCREAKTGHDPARCDD